MWDIKWVNIGSGNGLLLICNSTNVALLSIGTKEQRQLEFMSDIKIQTSLKTINFKISSVKYHSCFSGSSFTNIV